MPALVRAQLFLGGRVSLIGLAMFAGGLAALAYLSPTFDAEPDYGGIFASTVIGLIGLGMVLGSLPRAFREIRLLRGGRPAIGLVTDAKVRYQYRPPLALTPNRPNEWLVTFEFETEDGGTSRARVVMRAEPELDAEAEVLYDPRWPDHSAVLEYLPGKPEIVDGAVKLRAPNPLGALFAAIALGLLVLDLVILLRR